MSDLASDGVVAARLTPGGPAGATPQGLVNRSELALIAVERTRMPMVASDPRQPDNPIVLANPAFLKLTGYAADEVIGRNCRFLQGADTDRETVAEIRDKLASREEINVELLNYRKDGSSFWSQLHISPVFDDDGVLVYYLASQLDVTRRRDAQALESAEYALLLEVDHRARNALALVQGIVRLSRSIDSEAYAKAVQGRVDALALAHGLLSENRWRSVPLETLVQATVEATDELRVDIAGPPFDLAPGQVQPLALLLHELIANAVEHGALSAQKGRLGITWSVEGDHVVLAFDETGGPPPATVRPPGFGMTMIEAVARRQLRGDVAFDWQSGGLRSEVRLPREAA